MIPPIIPKKFLTNQGDNTLSNRLKTILPTTHEFCCLVGYFFISGFFRLYPALAPVKKIRILIGLKNEQVIHGLLQIAQAEYQENIPSTADIKQRFGDLLQKELIQAPDGFAIEIGIRTFIDWIRSGKLTVKLYREQNIHAKVYILTPENPLPDVYHGYVITGSSNLSYSGLEGHLEFNVLLNEPEDHDYALQRFNELWRDAVDVQEVQETIIDIVEKQSPFACFTPYQLYLKFLADYFRDYLGDRSKLRTENLPTHFKKLQYQEDAVFTAQQMLRSHGGVFIADVVGLGKTFIAALLALQLDGRCLVIAPPNLLDENSPGSWTRVFRDFCVPGHKCVSIGKLDELLAQGVDFYKYVFIDESHRFKGDMTQRYEYLMRICQNKGVILVSATPYNNNLDDIYSQLKLFQSPRNSTIPGMRNLEAFFKKLRERLKGLNRLEQAEQYAAAVEKNAQELRDRVLKYVMVRRTRHEIEQFYGDDLEKQNMRFPEVSDPIPLLYQLNATESALFTDTLQRITGADFHYARYQPLHPAYYIGPMNGVERALQGQRNLATFMKILLVKRLESSFYAFQQTLHRFIRSYQLVIQSLQDGYVYTSRKYSQQLVELLEAGDDDAMDALIEQDKVERLAAHHFTDVFRQHIASDLATLSAIQQAWAEIPRDPKWLEFQRELLTNPAFTTDKLIIFSEFADTACYLADCIKTAVEPKTILFNSAASPEQRRVVIANFDANSPEARDDYRILVTTDVLAEGVNLHRSAIVINYDIPWNPSRLMQRVGRVNRIGTRFKRIATYHFFPTDEGNDQIALTEAAKSKIRAFIALLGNDARLLTGDEQITSHNLFERLHSKQTAAGDSPEPSSELRYLRQILDIKRTQPALFQRILALPRKARSTCRVTQPMPLPAVLTYFRQGPLDKFFRADNACDPAEELDFLTAAQLLETTADESSQVISLKPFYALLDKNKQAFQQAITQEEEQSTWNMSGGSHETAVLNRFKAKSFRYSQAISADDRRFAADIEKLIRDGRIGKATLGKIRRALDNTDDPVEMIAILRKEIDPRYLLGKMTPQAENTSATGEIILSAFLLRGTESES